MLDSQGRYLVLQFALKDFKIRYTHSVLGYAWSVLNPILFTLIYFLVFSQFVRFEVVNYPGYLLMGVTLWNFFADASSQGILSMLARGGVLAKVNLPRQTVVYAAVLNVMLTFGINLVILGALLWWTGADLGWPLLAMPVLLLDLIALALGVALALAPLHVRFRDVGYLWSVAVQIGFWLTPIIYLDTMMPDRWRWLVDYNPLARIVLYARHVGVYGLPPDWWGIGKTSIFSAFFLLLGWLAFARLQGRVVEYL